MADPENGCLRRWAVNMRFELYPLFTASPRIYLLIQLHVDYFIYLRFGV